ncbi:MAG: hypothetical protein WAJ91_16795, partial [Rhodoplanes sp.]
RRPVDASFVFLIALALLSGYLLADYVREGLPRLRIAPSAIAAAGAMAVAVSAATFSARTGHAGDALFAALKIAPLAVLPAVLLVAARTARMRAYAAAAVVAIAVAELIWWNAAFRLNAESRSHYAVLERPTGAEAQAIAVLEEALRARHAQGERPRVEVLGLGGPWQNLASVRGWEATNGYNPLRIGAYDRLVAPGEANWRPDMRDFPASFDGYDCPLAHALGLEFLVLGEPIDQVPALKRRPVAEVLLAGPSIWIYRLHDPMPRITFTAPIAVADAFAFSGEVETGSPQKMRLPRAFSGEVGTGSPQKMRPPKENRSEFLIHRNGIRPGAGAARPAPAPRPDRVLIADDAPPRHSDGDFPAAGHARLVSWRPDRIEIEALSERGGILELHGNYYPGWIAEIDGKTSPILRADVLFRAVEVPAGRHRVVFRYAPFAWRNLADAFRTALSR